MSTTSTSCSSLRSPWSRLRADFDLLDRHPRNRRTVAAWAREDRRLGAVRTPADAARAGRGDDPDSVAVAVAMLEAAATSPLAARILFEAATPRLVHLSRRAGSYAAQSFCPHLVDPDHPGQWAPPEIVTADTINFGFEWILRHGGHTRPHPTRSLRDWVRDQLRIAASQAIRERAARRILHEQPHPPTEPPPAPTPTRLAELIRSAHRAGAISTPDAHLVYTTRTGQRSLHDAAAERNMVYDSVRRRRRRAEAQLRAHLDTLEPVQ